MKRWLGLLCLAGSFFVGRGAAASTVRVLVPDHDNLQYMAFWVADGAGYFHDEGIDLALSIPSAPQQTPDYVRRNDSDVAVLPPPMYLELIAGRMPIVLVANLLQNDPINLIVRHRVMEERKLSPGQPVGDKLRGLAGLRIGIAPNPPARMRKLFSTYGLDADRDVQMVTLHGPEQNYAFGDGKVDALYAHTPYLEEAIVDQGADILVNQSAGEVPVLSTRQIHALVCTRAFVEQHPATVTSLVRAVARAESLVHENRAAAVAALMHRFPSMDRRKVEALVAIYEPAIPKTPRVSADGFLPALALFPASRPAPSLDGIDLDAYVAPRFADAVADGEKGKRALLVLIGALALALALTLGLALARARQPRTTPKGANA